MGQPTWVNRHGSTDIHGPRSWSWPILMIMTWSWPVLTDWPRPKIGAPFGTPSANTWTLTYPQILQPQSTDGYDIMADRSTALRTTGRHRQRRPINWVPFGTPYWSRAQLDQRETVSWDPWGLLPITSLSIREYHLNLHSSSELSLHDSCAVSG